VPRTFEVLRIQRGKERHRGRERVALPPFSDNDARGHERVLGAALCGEDPDQALRGSSTADIRSALLARVLPTVLPLLLTSRTGGVVNLNDGTLSRLTTLH